MEDVQAIQDQFPTETPLPGTQSRKRVLGTEPPAGPSLLASIACKRCRSKKIKLRKCNGEYPTCSGCVKANVPCIVADWSTARDYSRAEVHELEKKLGQLEELLKPSGMHGNSVDANPTNNDSMGDERSSRQFPITNEDILLKLMPYQSQCHKTSPNVNFQLSSIIHHPPHQFPPNAEAVSLIEEYFREFHVAHPILNRDEVFSTLRCLSSTQLESETSKYELFNIYMVLAIGGIRLFRNGQSKQHPFGYFTAALEVKPPSGSAFNSIEDIIVFQLIAQFGVYFNIGCSLWELGRLCVRIAVELDLHQRQPNKNVRHTDPQRYHIVFWECYLLDRLSSTTLGRPFAIEDSAIHTSLPVEDMTMVTPGAFSPVVFNHLVRRGRLTSKIHESLNNANRIIESQKSACHQPPRNSSNIAFLFSEIRGFASELIKWRKSAPIFDQPCCLFESQQFFELSYQESRLWLIRAAIDALRPSTNMPPISLLRSCLQAAYCIVNTFNELREKGLVTFTRAYTHLIFVASLVIVLVVNIQSRHQRKLEWNDSGIDADQWLSELEDESPCPNLDEALSSLDTASKILNWFAEEMPDVVVYTQFFDSLKREAEKISRNLTNEIGDQMPDISLNDTSPSLHHSGRADVRCAPPVYPYNWNIGASARDQGHPIDLQLELDGYNSSGLGIPVNPIWDSLQNEGLQIDDAFSYAWHESCWPFSSVAGMEGLGSGISEHIWDMIPPWDSTPSTIMDN